MKVLNILICNIFFLLPLSLNAGNIVNEAYQAAENISKVSGSRRGLGWNDKRLLFKYYSNIQDIISKYEVGNKDPWCERGSRDPRCNEDEPRVPDRGREDRCDRVNPVDNECFREIRRTRPRWQDHEINYLCSEAPRNCVYTTFGFRPNWRAVDVVAVCKDMNHECVVQTLKYRKWATVADVLKECRQNRR